LFNPRGMNPSVQRAKIRSPAILFAIMLLISANVWADVSQGVSVLLDKHESEPIRLQALESLKKSIPADKEIVPALVVLAKDKKESAGMRNTALAYLLEKASSARAFSEDFIQIMSDGSDTPECRKSAAALLDKIASARLHDAYFAR